MNSRAVSVLSTMDGVPTFFSEVIRSRHTTEKTGRFQSSRSFSSSSLLIARGLSPGGSPSHERGRNAARWMPNRRSCWSSSS